MAHGIFNSAFKGLMTMKPNLRKNLKEKRCVQMWAESTLLYFNVRHSIVSF